MPYFSELSEELKNYLTSKDIDQVHQAYQFAAHAHEGQSRSSGAPYITHPLAVAHILAHMRMDVPTIIAAILHDVIEDTSTEKKTIASKFSEEIAELVEGMSKLTKIQFQNRAEAQAENFRKMLLAMAKDIRVIIIKLADRLHNMRTLDAVALEKKQRIARETLDIYAPIAQRLGMHTIYVELEDLGFFYLYPLRYRVLKARLKEKRQKNKPLVVQIEAAIKNCLEQHNLPRTAIWHKQKHLYRIYKQMTNHHLSFNEVMDAPIFCIIVDKIDTCYRVLGALHQLYKPLPEHFHDYIALPKANAYQALHTTLFGPYSVRVAIQIRTIEMDNSADYGVASYWLAKLNQGDITPTTSAKKNYWLERLLDIQKTTSSSLEFIETVKMDLFPAEIYLFTPKGDIIELPNGATPVDFAYAIHSQIGNTCIAAKVDKRSLPLSSHLATGQTVEIITQTDANPNSNWLNFVITGRAKSYIRQFLKEQQQSETVQFAERLIDVTLSDTPYTWSLLHKKEKNSIIKKLNYANEEALLEAIGLGYIPLVRITSLLPFLLPSNPYPLLIQGASNNLIQFAECCRPIPYDEIVGVLNPGHGLAIHLKRCKYVNRILKKQIEKKISTQWEEEIDHYFKAAIQIEVVNQRGVLAEVSTKIAMGKANIENLKIEDRGNEQSILHMTISVHNRKHLARVLRLLRPVPTVVKITRGKN